VKEAKHIISAKKLRQVSGCQEIGNWGKMGSNYLMGMECSFWYNENILEQEVEVER
jgi:hypothetical protein